MIDPWVNQTGNVVHPNAPSGGGGPGYFKPATPLGLSGDTFSSLPHPHSPAARHLAQNEIQRKHPKGKAAPHPKGKAASQPKAKAAPQPAPKWKDDDALNKKVKEEADGYVGKPIVGDGECYTLVDKLLPEAGAKSAPKFMPKITPDGDYIWGHQIDLKTVKPGDILQFRKQKMVIRTITIKKKIDPDTHKTLHTDKEGTIDEFMRGFPNHTSVVSSIDGDGALTVVEQHVLDRTTTGKSTGKLSTVVRRNKLYLFSTTRTLPKKVTRESLHVLIEEETTLEIKVSGAVKAYRPQPIGQ
jgi:hypothetical protein